MVSKQIRNTISGSIAYHFRVVPLREEEDALVLATPSEQRGKLMHDLSWVLNRKITFETCTESWLSGKILEYYGPEDELPPSVPQIFDR